MCCGLMTKHVSTYSLPRAIILQLTEQQEAIQVALGSPGSGETGKWALFAKGD